MRCTPIMIRMETNHDIAAVVADRMVKGQVSGESLWQREQMVGWGVAVGFDDARAKPLAQTEPNDRYQRRINTRSNQVIEECAHECQGLNFRRMLASIAKR